MRVQLKHTANVALALLVALSGSAAAQGKGQGKDKDKDKGRDDDKHRVEQVYRSNGTVVVDRDGRDRDRDGRDRDGRDRDGRDRDGRDRDGRDRDSHTVLSDGRRIPPGLAKKPGGMPPGQYKKHYGTNQGADVLGGILRSNGYTVVRVVPTGQSQYVYYRLRDGSERRAIVSPGTTQLAFSNVPASLLQQVLAALYQ